MGILGSILVSFKQSFGLDGKAMKGTYSRFSQTVPQHAALYTGVKEIQRERFSVFAFGFFHLCCHDPSIFFMFHLRPKALPQFKAMGIAPTDCINMVGIYRLPNLYLNLASFGHPHIWLYISQLSGLGGGHYHPRIHVAGLPEA